MDYNEFGLKQGAYNSGVIQNIAQTMSEFFDSPTYENRLTRLQDSLPLISTQVVLDMQKKLGRTLPPELISQLIDVQDIYADQLKVVLEDDNVEADIIAPFVNEAFFAIGNNADPSTMVTEAQKMKDAFVHYFITKVTTIVEQFERDLMANINGYFAVNLFRFTGPKDERNREWCHKHVNNVYTKEEIEAFADEEWDGQIPGTDGFTIWVNLGGYNCRHTLEPVTK